MTVCGLCVSVSPLQVGELAGGQAVSSVRESYSSALVQAEEKHRRELEALQQELERARGERDQEVRERRNKVKTRMV